MCNISISIIIILKFKVEWQGNKNLITCSRLLSLGTQVWARLICYHALLMGHLAWILNLLSECSLQLKPLVSITKLLKIKYGILLVRKDLELLQMPTIEEPKEQSLFMI